MSFVIVIPSRTASNLVACIASIRAAGETARVIVVWDGEWSEVEAIAPKLCGDVEIMHGEKPFCFARNCNIGIREAMGFDVVLCNDDVLLETPRGFTEMSERAWVHGYSCVSPRIRGAAHPFHSLEYKRGGMPVSEVSMVPFACVFIPRWALSVVGELDEQFIPGGFEDDDWCLRASRQLCHIGVCNNVVVDHQTLPHTFRPEGKPQLYELEENRKRFNEKWGKR